MKRRVILIVLPIILVLAVVASPALAKDPEQGRLWETITSLQEQVDSLQAYLDNFTEEDPVFSAMDTEADLEAQIGDNVLTQGESISLLDNDAGYITQALQVGNIVEVRKEESLDAFAGKWERISFSYDLPAGAIPISANGEVWVWWCDVLLGCDGYRLDADNYQISPSFYEMWDEEKVLFRCYYDVPFLYPLTDEVEFYFYYSYIQP